MIQLRNSGMGLDAGKNLVAATGCSREFLKIKSSHRLPPIAAADNSGLRGSGLLVQVSRTILGRLTLLRGPTDTLLV